MTIPRPLKVGIGGPVGSGKTALAEALCLRLREALDMAVITNDIYTKEDAEFLVRRGALGPERVVGVETGGCPHTAIREDASINLQAVDDLCRRYPDLDLVIIATPWDWHVDMAVAAMKHGKHAAVEVPAATTIEDCWRLVDTSEETRRHCMMLENCCYGANETTVLLGESLTRLQTSLDRLEERRLVTREKQPGDRRVVRVRLTDVGVALLTEVAGPLAECHARQLGHLAESDLKRLSALLREARRPHEPEGSVWR